MMPVTSCSTIIQRASSSLGLLPSLLLAFSVGTFACKDSDSAAGGGSESGESGDTAAKATLGEDSNGDEGQSGSGGQDGQDSGGEQQDSSSAGEDGEQTSEAGSNSDGADSDSTDTGDSGAETEGTGEGSAEEAGESGSGTGGNEEQATCRGTVYACGDGIDNDGDGLIDGADQECTGVCDDDEATFQTGIPGDNRDCKQDCFFDGNSGSGDDKCVWDIRCDPANPGEGTSCAYREGLGCPEGGEPSQECLDFCLGSVPNGCDCFGCCLVWLPDGSTRTVFLGSGGDCSLDNLDACKECTINHDCENECEPEECEECIGDTPVPIDCEEAECEDKLPCEDQSDCPAGFWCSQGCCYPNPVP